MSQPQSSPTTKVEAYLFFDGRCEEALEYYKQTLGAEVLAVMHYKDNPDPASCGPVPPDKVMHSCFRVGETTIMASDGHSKGQPKFEGFSLSLTAPDEAAANKYFAALSQGGQVILPLTKTFYSPCFGMLTDKFGVGWMVIVLDPGCKV
jgi:PhnB protein